MIIDLSLQDIRSYKEAHFSFGPLTVIQGRNGAGKTNIIESIYFLSTGRSFHTSHDGEMIRFNQPFGRIVSGDVSVTLVNGPKLQKQVRIHQKPAKLLEILGELPSVLFTPNSLALLDGPPALRRQFMDILLSQVDRSYARNLLGYQHVLKQRNGLLHQIVHGQANADTLELWDDLLVKASLPVISTRQKMIEEMQKVVAEFYQRVSRNAKDVLEISYSASVTKYHQPHQKTGHDLGLDVAAIFHERLLERRSAELHLGRTVVGPHRDELTLSLNQKPVALYGSRGEMRSAVVALKLFEYSYLKEHGEHAPTLLFDDVFSEFDQNRREAVLKIAPEAQIIFTATDLGLMSKLPSGAEVIKLDK